MTVAQTASHKAPDIVSLYYEEEGGEHFFRSPTLPGFLVAGAELEKLYSQLGVAVSTLVEARFGTKVQYHLDRDFTAFADSIGLEPIQARMDRAA